MAPARPPPGLVKPARAAWLAVVLLLIVQLLLMAHLLRSPRERAAWYNGTGVTLYVIGMLVTAFALRS